mmetsp:Transcript_13631/g.37515  ORF Transcript_13631/g.37515 Transcript_13631/m.37515 type:complete len:262 (+) Transcript_13631:221-1006(+)
MRAQTLDSSFANVRHQPPTELSIQDLFTVELQLQPGIARGFVIRQHLPQRFIVRHRNECHQPSTNCQQSFPILTIVRYRSKQLFHGTLVVVPHRFSNSVRRIGDDAIERPAIVGGTTCFTSHVGVGRIALDQCLRRREIPSGKVFQDVFTIHEPIMRNLNPHRLGSGCNHGRCEQAGAGTSVGVQHLAAVTYLRKVAQAIRRDGCERCVGHAYPCIRVDNRSLRSICQSPRENPPGILEPIKDVHHAIGVAKIHTTTKLDE